MILIVSEKPKAAERIARALDCHKRYRMKGVYYFKGKNLVVVPSVGHLFELTTYDKGIPVLNYKWIEAYNIKGKDYTKNYIEVIKYLSKNSDELIIATDYDTEGELLGYNIYRFLCNHLPVNRMKFSSLTRNEIIRAFKNTIEINKNLVDSGEARHVLDFLWGLNVSRCLMKIFNNKRILSAGRVQSPALNLILEREEEIKKFVPKSYYRIYLIAKKGFKIYKFEYAKSVENIIELSKIINLKQQLLKVEDLKERIIEYEIYPFNLSDLQQEAYSIYKISPKKTLEIAEELYLKSLISYPRTDSQKFPKSLNFREIIASLEKIPLYKNYCKKLLRKGILIPKEGKKSDDAHPCIYPTGELPRNLTKKEALIYDLIVRRFIGCFLDNLKVQNFKATVYVANNPFYLTWNKIQQKGWYEIYYFKTIEEKDVDLKLGDILYFVKYELKKYKTKPPPRYTRASLVKKLETLGLGTKATRADIVEKLFIRNYVSGDPIRITKLGVDVVNILKEYVPEICSVELTRKFEEKLRMIERGVLRKEQVIKEAKTEIINIVNKFLDNLEHIRKKIAFAT